MSPLCLLLLLCAPALAQRTLITGQVADRETGAPLPGATVAVVDTALGTIADAEGRYQLTLPAGQHRLRFSFIGYAPWTSEVLTAAGAPLALDAVLEPAAIALGDMTITPGRFAIMGDAPPSRQVLTQEEIQSIPQFGDDIFRSISRLPGVASSDYSARFAVRGGENDQVLVLVDGVELYDPFHLKDINGGALSIIDVNLISGIDLLTGGFPAEYGQRLSGVFDVKTATPEPGSKRLGLGLSIMNTRLLAEGDDGRSAWLISARRGYVDLVLRLMGESEEFRPVYYDAFAKYHYKLSDQHQVQASLLHSRDDLDFVEDDDDESTTGYDNTYAWVSLQSALSARLLARSTLAGGRVAHDRRGLAFFGDRDQFDFQVRDERRFDFLSLRQDWTFSPSDNHYLKWGLDLRRLEAAYDYLSEKRLFWRGVDGLLQARLDTTCLAAAPVANIAALYAADRLRLYGPLTAEIGLRYDRASHSNDSYFSPRLNLMYAASRRTSWRAAWGYFYQGQGINELEASDGEADFHKAQRAEHRVVGLEHLFSNDVHLRLEGYDKRLSSLRPSHRNWLNEIEIFPELQGDRVRLELSGARARGLELYLKRDQGGRFKWWLSYALARFRDEVQAISANGQTFAFNDEIPAQYDQRHTFNLDLSYCPNERWRLNAAWQYRSGWPFTDQVLRMGRDLEGNVFFYDQPGTPNGENYPAFHRLDLRASRAFAIPRGRLRAFVEVTNLYNHGNVRTYEFLFRCGNTPESCHYEKFPAYWFRLLPSMGIDWNWDL
jgi:outer membrane receptor protein involved in Fe transport